MTTPTRSSARERFEHAFRTTYVEPLKIAWRHVRPRDYPSAASWLLIAITGVFVAEWLVFFAFGVRGWELVFDLHPAWWVQPWAVILAVLAHIPPASLTTLALTFSGFGSSRPS